MHRGLLNWGIFLIVLAAVPLAVQLGYLDAAAASSLLRFWPLILIAIGLGLILRFTPFSVLGGVLAAGTLGLLAGALLAGGVGSIGGACVAGGSGGSLELRSGPFSGSSASVDLELTCVELSVERQPGSEWRLEGDYSGTGAPSLDASATRLSLRSIAGQFFIGNQARREMRLALPTEQSLSMSMTINASSGTVKLGGGNLGSLNTTLNASDARLELAGAVAQDSSLNLTLNASSGTLALPAASLNGNISLNASSLELCVVPDAGLRIRYSDTLSSNNFDGAGLTRSGELWVTPGYDQAALRTELTLNGNVSSITLHRTGGCP